LNAATLDIQRVASNILTRQKAGLLSVEILQKGNKKIRNSLTKIEDLINTTILLYPQSSSKIIMLQVAGKVG